MTGEDESPLYIGVAGFLAATVYATIFLLLYIFIYGQFVEQRAAMQLSRWIFGATQGPVELVANVISLFFLTPGYYASTALFEDLLLLPVVSDHLRPRLSDQKYHTAVHVSLYSLLLGVRYATYYFGFDIGIGFYMVIWGGAIIALTSRLISAIPLSQLEYDRLHIITEHVKTGKDTAHSESLRIPAYIVLYGELALFYLRLHSQHDDITTPIPLLDRIHDFVVSNAGTTYLNIDLSFFVLYVAVATFMVCTQIYIHNVANGITLYKETPIAMARLKHQISLGRSSQLVLLLASLLTMRWYSPIILFAAGVIISFLIVGPFVGIIENILQTGPSAIRRMIAKFGWYCFLPLAVVGDLIAYNQATEKNVVIGIVSGLAATYVAWFGSIWLARHRRG